MSESNTPVGSTNEPAEKFQPDVYYFPSQVAAELDDIQSNVLGKILTLIDAVGFDSQQKKAIKDLIRTVVKEQIIRTRRMLDDRLEKLLELGMKPIDMQSTRDKHFMFFRTHRVTPVYEEGDMSEDPRELLG